MSLLQFLGITSSPAQLETGADAPKLKATDHNGEQVDLGEVFAKGTTLVFFYPKADTPGCTAQACSLRDAFEELTKKNVTIFGVSLDNVQAQKKFVEKHNLPYRLIADADGAVVTAFGVPRTGSFAKRQCFLIKDGKVIYRNPSAPTAKQAQEILAVLDKK